MDEGDRRDEEESDKLCDERWPNPPFPSSSRLSSTFVSRLSSLLVAKSSKSVGDGDSVKITNEDEVER